MWIMAIIGWLAMPPPAEAAAIGMPPFADIHVSQLDRASAPAAVKGHPVWSVRTPDSLDLSMQFVDPDSTREQGSIGNCHIFASIAVLEAAYFREYGTPIRFSEADLFLRHQILIDPVAEQLCKTGYCRIQEAYIFDVAGDIKDALANGVASSFDYSSFEKIYKSRDPSEEGISLKDLKVSFHPDHREEPTVLHALEVKDALLHRFAGSDETIDILDAERAAAKAKFKGFKLFYRVFPIAGPLVFPRNDAERMECGRNQKRVILQELEAERPVAVGMYMNGAPYWPEGTTGGHSSAIVGYETDLNGRLVFKTRDSWGHDHPDLPEDQLYRIMEIASVRAPADRK